jgi:2-hydroxy-6-oxonona-2,4-dienedioate hydrolase
MVQQQSGQDAGLASRGLTDEEIIDIPGLHSRWVRLASGSKAHYMTAGESGPAVVLLHGGIVGSSGTAGWRFMAPFLGANGFRVYCPDQPGFGLSDTTPLGQEYVRMGSIGNSRFINDFADALCLDQFHLGGNSMGMINTVHYTLAYPERVKSMLLIAGFFGDLIDRAESVQPKDGRWTPNPDYTNVPFDGTEQSMIDLMMGIIYRSSAVWPSLATMRTKAALRQAESTKLRIEATARLAKDPNLDQFASAKGRFTRLTIPGIYLYGMQDVLLPVEIGFKQEELGFDNIQFFYPDECGHQGQTDQPDMFNQAALEFFKDGKVRWETAEWAGVSRRIPIKPSLVQAPASGFPKPDPSFNEQFTREAKAKSGAPAG